MNRERAETYLRLLAEAELRDALAPLPCASAAAPRAAPRAGDTPFVTTPVSVTRAAWALTAVGALDLETAEDIMADVELALLTRYSPEAPEAGVISATTRIWSAGLQGPRLGPNRFANPKPLIRMSKLMPGVPDPGPPGAALGAAAKVQGPDGQGGPGRYVPVGLMILFHDETISGELDLMSYAHTAGGARLVATWRTRDPLGSRHHGLPPVERFDVTDDRGQDYQLVIDPKGRPEWTCDLDLIPDPPPDIRWLDITAPGEHCVRVDLSRQTRWTEPDVSEVELSVGEQLLNRIAERLLGSAPDFPPIPRTGLTGPLINIAAGLGAAVAALRAAEALPPASPVPGQLATLCTSLDLRNHGIADAPAPELPEPWLSLLAHYQRRKPDIAPGGDGFAAVAAALPELDGIRLVLLGLHNDDDATWVNALVFGKPPGRKRGSLGLDITFPLSIWVRDSTGRWHVARPTGWFGEDGEAALTLRLAPPLTRSPDWIEVLAAGPSAQVRATLPLRWGCPP